MNMKHFIAILFAVGCFAQGVRDNNPRLLSTSAYAALGTPGNGTILYCSDCTATNPCAGSGSGAMARRENGAWNCGGGSGSSNSIFQFVAKDRQDHISRCDLEVAEANTAVTLCSYPSADESYFSTYVMFVPASYTSGTVTAVVQWTHASGTDASKTFKFDLYLACGMTAFGSANTLTVNDTTATDHSLVTSSPVSLTNTAGSCTAGALARLKIVRQTNANFTSTVNHWIGGVKVTWP